MAGSTLVERLKQKALTQPNKIERAACIETEAADRIAALEAALRNIRYEAERENGGWVHLKKCIAVQARTALERPNP